LAQRLGCSLSTVKRHLRRERRQPSALRRSEANCRRGSCRRSYRHWLHSGTPAPQGCLKRAPAALLGADLYCASITWTPHHF
jgi:hypothetical protein